MNYGVNNSGSGSITSHGGIVAGVGNVVGVKADLMRKVGVLRELVNQSEDQLSTTDRYASRGAIEEISEELAKETPERSRLVAGIEHLKSSAKSIGGVVVEATKLSDAIRDLLT